MAFKCINGGSSLHIHLIKTIVGEPKSIIVQKRKMFAPKRLRLDFCILIVKIVLDMKPLYSNASRIAFRSKSAFCLPHRSVKQLS